MTNKIEIKKNRKQKFLISYFSFLISAFCFQLSAFAQIPTCVNALAASPPGPFPCSVVVQWIEGTPNTETGFIVERRLNAGPWLTLGGGPTAANVTNLIDATLQQSSTVENVYDYRVSAVNSAGSRPGVSPVMATFKIAQAAVLPGSPTGITVTFKGAKGVMLCPTCTGGDRKVPFAGDEGTFDIVADEITIALK